MNATGAMWEYPPFFSEAFASKLQNVFFAWLNKYVIHPSSEDNQDWHFRTLFVAEISILPIVLPFVFVFWWIVNRNAHLRKTKGSSIPLRENREEEEEEEGDEFRNTMAFLKRYSVEVENDDDGETLISMESYFDDSDFEDASESLVSNFNFKHIKNGTSQTEMFLSKEKRNLWKVMKELPIFSFFNEEAIEICLNEVEYVNLDKSNEFLWKQNEFDGSLFYIMKGKVKVNFLDFKAPSTYYQRGKGEETAYVVHEEETVITSQLALIEGMVQHYLGGKSSSLGRFVGLALNETTAQAMADDTRLLRIPPSCFSRILDRFPDTMLRIIQTTLNRTQRITSQTLVRCCGLRQELLVPKNNEMEKSMSSNTCNEWKTLQNDLKNARASRDSEFGPILDQDKDRLVKNACSVLANKLGIEDSGTIEVLEEKCSLTYFSGEDEHSNRTLLRAGSNHDSCYLLLKGEMEVGMHQPLGDASSKQLQNDESLWYFQSIVNLFPGSILGASGLFTSDVNLFEVRHVPGENDEGGAVLLQIPKGIYGQLVVKHPKAMATLLAPILSAFSPVVRFVNWTTEWIHIEAAEEIVQKGTQCNSLFVVLNGRLRAANRSKASEVIPPKEYGRGKIFGQIGALANVDWQFDVFAIRQSELAKVPIKTIEVVVQNFPHAGLFLARTVASDVESLYLSNRQHLQQRPPNPFVGRMAKQLPNGSLPFQLPSYGLNLATIAVVPLSYNVDMKRFCRTLNQAMESIAPCKLLTKALVKRELGEKVYHNRNALHDIKMTRFLADLEENNRVVIYQADPRFTFWTRLCILQADYVLLVTDSHKAPETSRVEQTVEWAYKAMDVRIDLVVVGKEESGDESSESDSDTSFKDEDDVHVSDQLNNWSESREWITGHHLVRAPFKKYRVDFHRMCRRISGRSVGLVLGAGGARGIAHLGVIRALMEAGVTVDMVGGTSQGAFCGALFARYPDDYGKMFRAFREMARDSSSIKEKIFELTLPITSMFSGRNFNKAIKRLLGNLRIQDLVLKFFCVSTDLQNENMAVHTKGSLWKYVRASMGLTGYLPPVSENGSLLVDGGYVNSLPADVMKHQMGARTVIAVDVMYAFDREYYEYGAHLSGWWVLWNSWNPFVKTVHVPSMGDVSDMLIWISSEHHRNAVKMVCDLHLSPPVKDIGTLEFDRFDEIVEKGYIYAKPLVDEWVRKNPWLVGANTKAVKTDSRADYQNVTTL